MPRGLYALFTLLLVAVTAPAQTVHNIWEPPFKQGIAAKVEDQIITFEELRRELAPLIPRARSNARTEEEFQEQMGELYQEVLQNLIDRVLIVKAFYDKEYQLPQTFVENEFDRILVEEFENDRSRFLEHLENQGQTAREFRRDLAQRIIVSVMRGQMRATEAEVSPERIEQFYNENKIHFFEEERVYLRLIMLKPIADESPDLLRQNAERVMKELDQGRPFESVAREYSQDSRKDRGGDWGWINRSDLREELSDIAFALEPGEYSEPVAMGSQIFILYVEEKSDEGIQPLDAVRDTIENILVGQLRRQAQRQWLERLRRDAFIKYY